MHQSPRGQSEGMTNLQRTTFLVRPHPAADVLGGTQAKGFGGRRTRKTRAGNLIGSDAGKLTPTEGDFRREGGGHGAALLGLRLRRWKQVVGETPHLRIARVVLPVLNAQNGVVAKPGIARHLGQIAGTPDQLCHNGIKEVCLRGHGESLGKHASECKAFLPQIHRQNCLMHGSDEILSENLKKLMASRPDLSSQAAVGEKAGIDQRTVGRIINREHSPSLEKIQGLAKAFGLQPWQILSADFGAAPLSFGALDAYEASLITAFRLLPETDKRALLMHVNERVRGNQGIGQTDEVEAAGEDVPLTREQSNKPRESETSWQRKPQFGRPVQTTNHPDFPDKIYSAEANPAHKVAGRRKGGKQ